MIISHNSFLMSCFRDSEDWHEVLIGVGEFYHDVISN